MDWKKIAKKYEDEIITTTQEMLRIPSKSTEEGEIARYIQNKMRELGYDKVEVDQFGNVFGTMKGTGKGPSLMLNCHMDTVDEGDVSKWKYPPFSGEIAEGKIWGRGASDTKGTMAVQLWAPAILRKEGVELKGDVITACVISEEIAGFGAMLHTQAGTHLTDYAILGEATENQIAIGNRGRFCAVITIDGKSCHASIPQTGRNPFDFLTELLPRLKEVEMGKDELFGESTMSITRLVSSEPGSNVIPNTIEMYVDFRSSTADPEDVALAKIQAAIDAVPLEGFRVNLRALYFPITTYTGYEGEGYQGEYPFSIAKDDPFVLLCKNTLEETLGKSIDTYPWKFATDAGHYAAKGVKCIGYSPAEIVLCHTTSDNIDIAMQKEGTVGYLALISTIVNQ